jgi:hypothetical protein
LLSLLSYRTQDYQPRDGPTLLPWSLIEKMPYSWISWRHFPNWSTILCDNSSLCQVDTNLVSTVRESCCFFFFFPSSFQFDYSSLFPFPYLITFSSPGFSFPFLPVLYLCFLECLSGFHFQLHKAAYLCII